MSNPTVRLPFTLRHGYGMAALSIAVANTAILFFLLKFLIDEVGLAPGIAGTVLLVGKAWDAVTDPLVGKLSDRTRTGFGPRRTWLAGGMLPFLLLFGAIWWGLDAGATVQAVIYAGLLVLYNTAYTMVVVPYGALTPVLTEDYDERTRLNGARMGWSMVGGILAGVGIPLIAHADGGSWRLAGLVMAVIALPPLVITLWVTRGRDRLTAPSATPTGTWSVLKNRAFRRTALLFLAAWSIIAAVSAMVPFYVEHHMHHPKLLDGVFAAIQFAALFAIPAVVLLAKRTQKHIAYALSIGTWALVLLGLALVPEGTGLPVLAVAALAGVGVAAAHVLPWSMLPDVIEADKADTGQDRAGAFYGVMTFLEKATTAVALFLLGQVLGLAGYVEGAATQPESARIAILCLVGPLPGIVLLAAAIFAWKRPPMTRDEHQELLGRLGKGTSSEARPSGAQASRSPSTPSPATAPAG